MTEIVERAGMADKLFASASANVLANAVVVDEVTARPWPAPVALVESAVVAKIAEPVGHRMRLAVDSEKFFSEELRNRGRRRAARGRHRHPARDARRRAPGRAVGLARAGSSARGPPCDARATDGRGQRRTPRSGRAGTPRREPLVS